MMVNQEDRKDAVLLAMSDGYMRRILSSIISEAKSVDQISKESGVPASTCYRRIHELLGLALVRIEKTIITPEGKKYETFRSTVIDVKISFSSQDLSIELTPMKIAPEDRLHSMWRTTKKTDDRSQESLAVLEVRAQ
jgi:DNA-binding Lrp family transcriptional regulator